MGRYRKIDPKIWNDAKFMALSNEAQRIFLCILTHPQMTGIGAFRATIGGMADELRIDPKGFPELFQELLSKGLVKYDEKACMIFAPNFLKYNQPENPNVVQGWIKTLEFLPECPLLVEVLSRAIASAEKFSNNDKALGTLRAMQTLSEELSKELGKPFPEPLLKGSPIQRTENREQIYTPSNEGEIARDARAHTRTRAASPKLNFYGLPEQLQRDWSTSRKKKITQTAIDGVKREAEKAGITFEQAVRFIVERGWESFRAPWWKNVSAEEGTTEPDQSPIDRAYYNFRGDEYAAGRIPIPFEEWKERFWDKRDAEEELPL